MNLFKVSFLALALSSLMFFSCSKDDTSNPKDEIADPKDETADPREQLVGRYFGSAVFTAKYSAVPALGKDDKTTSDTDSIEIMLDANTSDGITITDIDAVDGNTIYKANAVTAAANGATFNIPAQTITSADGTFSFDGFSCYTLGNLKYDGGYDSQTKVVTFGMEGTISWKNEAGETITIPFTVVYSIVKL